MDEPVAPELMIPLSQQPTIDLGADTPGPWWKLIIDRNPLFLFSGVLILAGCFLVSQYIHEMDPAEVGEGVVIQLLIGLLLVLNIYEFAVIGLGLALARTRTLVRDARHLIGVALLLLVDEAFVYTESGIGSPGVGAAIAGVATLLAILKVWLITRSLRIDLTGPAIAVIGITLAAMYGLPSAVRALADDGFLSQPQAMLLWVGLGVIVALFAVPTRWVRLSASPSADQRQLQRLVAGGLILLPIVSLVGHTWAALWVYENAFEPAMLSPMLLGLAAVVLRHRHLMHNDKSAAKAATLVVASAIVTSLIPADSLTYQSAHGTWLAVSPLRCVLLIAPLLLIWAWWAGGRRPIGLINAVLPLFAAALGHTPRAMVGNTRWLYDALHRIMSNTMPTSKLQWGLLAIAMAFGCLLLGGVLRWWRRSHEGPDAPTSDLLADPG